MEAQKSSTFTSVGQGDVPGDPLSGHFHSLTLQTLCLSGKCSLPRGPLARGGWTGTGMCCAGGCPGRVPALSSRVMSASPVFHVQMTSQPLLIRRIHLKVQILSSHVRRSDHMAPWPSWQPREHMVCGHGPLAPPFPLAGGQGHSLASSPTGPAAPTHVATGIRGPGSSRVSGFT